MRLLAGSDLKGPYPLIAEAVCKKVVESKVKDTFGILTCKTGIGMCIVANKFKGIRAVNATSLEVVKKARERNNCNVVCLGRDLLSSEEATELLTTFLTTKYQGESNNNLRLIRKIERRNFK